MVKSDSPLGVAYVLRKFPVLSETFILNEILALEARGIPVHVFSLMRPNDPHYHQNLAQLKAPISYLPGPSELGRLLRYNRRAAKRYGRRYYRTLLYVLLKGRPKLLWRFLQSAFIADRARRFRVDHLHSHFATRPTTVAMLASMITDIPYSFTAHAYDIYKKTYSRNVIGSKIKSADFVVTICEVNRTYLAELEAGAGDKIKLIHNGINLERFRPDGVAPATPFTILAVARLIEKKGLPVLIEACKQLRDRGVEFRCLIIGEGRQRPQLFNMIKARKLERQVRLLGALKNEEVLKWYHAAHLFALPSIVSGNGDREGLPVSIVEALACGLPVVSTPSGGIPEAVLDRYNGLLVESGDAAALADGLRATIEDKELYGRLKANARASVLERFDQARTTEKLCHLFAGRAE